MISGQPPTDSVASGSACLMDKEYFAFPADGKIMTAMVYRMDPERFPIEPPRPDYLQTVADGYRTFKYDVSKLVDIADRKSTRLNSSHP